MPKRTFKAAHFPELIASGAFGVNRPPDHSKYDHLGSFWQKKTKKLPFKLNIIVNRL